ncbi:hypothetical protein SAG0136_03235 [Streptococcus agalactiae LMG 14747]|uniref:Quinone oxidoreductase n=1 Tax=Streptococcus agalactiae LMG 14747 TaxID=1154860 RepID=V6Z210_STRAG|nr:hypothetical protein SAG0136_03235 [Streptococcus agalactiae LMG 14747]
MKAAYITETGPTDRIIWGELSDPNSKTSEILIEVEAIAINAVDTFIRSGFTKLNFPHLLSLVGMLSVVWLK